MTEKNSNEYILLLVERSNKIAERGSIITRRSEIIENRKHKLQSHILAMDEAEISDEVVEKYNALTRQSHELVQKRKEIFEIWKKFQKERNELNAVSEEMLKYYNMLNDGGESTQIMNKQIEQNLSHFEQILTKLEGILNNREAITVKEELIITQSEQLIGLRNSQNM